MNMVPANSNEYFKEPDKQMCKKHKQSVPSQQIYNGRKCLWDTKALRIS